MTTIWSPMKYQIGTKEFEIDRLLASLYSEEKTGLTAICWMVQKGDVIAPVELQQEDDPFSYWQRLLNPNPGLEIELLVNPIGQSDYKYLEHPIVKSLNDISKHWACSVPTGAVADQLHMFTVPLVLSSLSFQGNLDWSYFPAKAKMLELIKRRDFFRGGVGALSQGLIYLTGSATSERDYTPGSLVAVQSHRRRRFTPSHRSQESYRVGNSTYSPRKDY